MVFLSDFECGFYMILNVGLHLILDVGINTIANLSIPITTNVGNHNYECHSYTIHSNDKKFFDKKKRTLKMNFLIFLNLAAKMHFLRGV